MWQCVALIVVLLLLQVDAADNIDLLCILQDFEEGYEAKYGRRPKLVRRVSSEEVRMSSSCCMACADRVLATSTKCSCLCLHANHSSISAAVLYLAAFTGEGCPTCRKANFMIVRVCAVWPSCVPARQAAFI